MPRQGTSNEYHQNMFLWRNKKNISTLVSYLELWGYNFGDILGSQLLFICVYFFLCIFFFFFEFFFLPGWSDGAKVSCSLHHRGVQLILAYSWARPATLVAGKGRGGMFLFLLFLHFHFLFLSLPCPSLPSPLLSILSLFSLFLGDDTK